MRSRFPLLAALATSACITHLGDEAPSFGRVTGDCVVSVRGAREVTSPVAAELGGRVVWVFERVVLDDGTAVHGARAALPDAGSACGGVDLERDPAGRVVALLEPDADDRAADAARKDGRETRTAPLAAVGAEGGGALYYEVSLVDPSGARPAEPVGVGVCALAGPRCDRAGRPRFDRRLRPSSALRSDDGSVLVLSCTSASAFEQTCTLARATAASALDPAAYEVRGIDGWSRDPAAAVAVAHDPGATSLRLAPGDAGPALVVVDPFEARVSARVARAWGEPFGDRRPLFGLAPPPPGSLVGGGLAQPGTGSRVVVAYTTSNPERPGLHLASFELDRGLR